jgi:hypothetical protein
VTLSPVQRGMVIGRLNRHLGWFQSMDEARALCEWLGWSWEQLMQEMLRYTRRKFRHLEFIFPESLEEFIKQSINGR